MRREEPGAVPALDFMRDPNILLFVIWGTQQCFTKRGKGQYRQAQDRLVPATDRYGRFLHESSQRATYRGKLKITFGHGLRRRGANDIPLSSNLSSGPSGWRWTGIRLSGWRLSTTFISSSWLPFQSDFRRLVN